MAPTTSGHLPCAYTLLVYRSLFHKKYTLTNGRFCNTGCRQWIHGDFIGFHLLRADSAIKITNIFGNVYWEVSDNRDFQTHHWSLKHHGNVTFCFVLGFFVCETWTNQWQMWVQFHWSGFYTWLWGRLLPMMGRGKILALEQRVDVLKINTGRSCQDVVKDWLRQDANLMGSPSASDPRAKKYGPTCHQRDRADVTEFVTLVRLSSLGQHVAVLALAGYKRRKSALTANPI